MDMYEMKKIAELFIREEGTGVKWQEIYDHLTDTLAFETHADQQAAAEAIYALVTSAQVIVYWETPDVEATG